MGRDDEGAPPPVGRQRIDKWLWHARVVKTRALAAEIVASGKVRRNRDRLDKPADTVRSGDVLTITLSHRVLILRVLGFSERRGSADDARPLYEDLSPERPPRGEPGA
jgi:ribosome-associated heat shock protein Hsp15